MLFQFDHATHTYRVDGITVPSVTRILDSAGLVSYGGIRTEVLERKSELGTKVHQATQFYDENDLDWNSLSDEVKPRVEAWASFRNDTGFQPRQIEKRFIATVQQMQYGMTVDREGFFGRKNEEAVIEIKNSAKIESWHAIQLAGYALGLPDIDGKTTSSMALFCRRRRIVVQLLETGKYKKFDFTDRNDAGVFISALHVTHWKLSKGMKLEDLSLEA